MAKTQKKYYVVWQGRKTGIFETWAECSAQVSGYPGARYKSFLSRAEAVHAFGGNSRDFIGQGTPTRTARAAKAKIGQPILDSISVDAACNGSPGTLEYRGVDTATGKVLFAKGPFRQGTNNVGEFLAIVHAAALLKQTGDQRPIYSDSRTALSWVRKKKANTNLARTTANKQLFALIDKAEAWLQENPIENRVLKWETEAWGEIAADYGRK